MGKFFLYLIVAFLALSLFFVLRAVDIFSMLQATWDIIVSIPRYLRDVNMFSALIRTWFKKWSISWFLDLAQSYISAMDKASRAGDVFTVILTSVCGLTILLLFGLVLQHIHRVPEYVMWMLSTGPEAFEQRASIHPRGFDSTIDGPPGSAATAVDEDENVGRQRTNRRRNEQRS